MDRKNEAAQELIAPTVIPIGVARHVRVQFRGSPTGAWRRFGVYSRRSQAVACVDRLRAGGYSARLVDFQRMPVAG
ncbi:MAG: hypothetical protein DCC68_21090 [Planctomycetota bacterium]|nr:MAG: hypothetical protein DCC68_21090 [Planctomycetota bacterium]